MAKPKDSWKKLGMDLAKAGWFAKDFCGGTWLINDTLQTALLIRARSLRLADRKRKGVKK